MTSRAECNPMLLQRAARSGALDDARRLTRGRDHSFLAVAVNTRRKQDFPTMPVDELRVASMDLCDRNEQLEHVLRKMLGTVQVGLSRDFEADTLQELYETWKDAIG